MPYGDRTSTSSPAPWTCISAGCGSPSTGRMSWTWFAPCGPPGTPSIRNRCNPGNFQLRGKRFTLPTNLKGEPMDADAKKTALRMIPYGIYVLTADDHKGNV